MIRCSLQNRKAFTDSVRGSFEKTTMQSRRAQALRRNHYLADLEREWVNFANFPELIRVDCKIAEFALRIRRL